MLDSRAPDEAALLAAVWDRPHDDLPRLVYADWLEDHGDAARAEFIRLQCDIAACELRGDDPPGGSYDRERELRAAHGAGWREGFPETLTGTGFGRGFPTRARPNDVTTAAFVGRPTTARPSPLLDVRVACPTAGDLARFLAAPLTPWVGELRLEFTAPGGWGLAETAAVLAARDRLENLTEFWLVTPVSTEAVTELAAGLPAPHLRLFYAQPADDLDLFATLAASPLAARLSVLYLDGPVADKLAWVRGRFPRLRALQLDVGFEGDRTLAHADVVDFLRSPTGQQVRALTITVGSGQGLAGGEAGGRLTDYLQTTGAAGLRRLTLQGCKLNAADLDALTRSPALESLAELFIGPQSTAALPPPALRARFGRRLRFR